MLLSSVEVLVDVEWVHAECSEKWKAWIVPRFQVHSHRCITLHLFFLL